MEWVETTGRSVEEALEAALDQLGIDERDAEVEVVEEPKTGLFGRLRSEARVRARVRPTRPRPKAERPERSRKRPSKARPEPKQPAPPRTATAPPERRPEGDDVMDRDVPLSEQAEIARVFLEGLVARLGLTGAAVGVREIDEETVELRVEGSDLGFLIGPRGTTLGALQDVTRTVVNRKTGGRNGRILVDVAGYREKRKVALERFVQDVAAEVKAGGAAKILEPMNPADRKVVHDAVNQIEGVSTTSEGEEPNRRVVIQPE
ncbi:MAG: Jag N-terminal domain-containing protein [Actinomycetota bacterium]|nr:Jag N-terminal domain-containing protein [Actinomycetota bacterium]